MTCNFTGFTQYKKSIYYKAWRRLSHKKVNSHLVGVCFSNHNEHGLELVLVVVDNILDVSRYGSIGKNVVSRHDEGMMGYGVHTV